MAVEEEFDPIARYERFFKEYALEDGQIKYRNVIEKMPLQDERSLEINFDDLWNFDPELAKRTLEAPSQYINAAAEAIKNMMMIEAEDYAKQTFHARFKNLPKNHQIHLRKLRSDHIGRLISVNGILTRASEVKPQLMLGIFECKSCRERIPVVQGDFYTVPYQCPNNQCNKKGPFTFIAQESKFIDWQKIRIQEKPEELPAGQMPRSLDALLEEDLVDSVRPGNRITAVGILYSARDQGQHGSLKTFHIYLEVNSIDTSETDSEQLDITPQDTKKIEELAKDEWIHRKIIHSIAPTIYGYDDVKEAIAHQLFGGVSKDQKDGTKFRGDSHVLLVGDPGTGKSMILQYVAKIAPRGLYTSGKGSSAVGLTAAVLRDKDTGDFTLEAGALVLADLGCACLSSDSKVLVNDKIISIENAFNNECKFKSQLNNEEIELSELNANICSINPDLKVISSKSNLVRRKNYCGNLFNIKFNSGFEIKVTPEHQLIDGNTLEWKEARDFNKNDYIIAPLKIPEHDKQIFIFDIIPDEWLVILKKEEKTELRNKIVVIYKTLSEFNKKYEISRDFLSGRSPIKAGKLKQILRDLKIYPEWRNKYLKYGRKGSGELLKVNKITPELAYFIGFLYGDGSVKITPRRSGVQITQSLKNKDQIEQLNKVFRKFSYKNLKSYERISVSSIRGKKVESANTILSQNSNLIAYIYHYFIGNNLQNILELSNEALSAFIAGCMDSDGCISIKTGKKLDRTYESVHIEFMLSNNEEKNRSFMLALRRFDCFSKMIKSKSNIIVRITGREDVEQIMKNIKEYSVKVKEIPSKKHLVSSFSNKIPSDIVARICNKIATSINKSTLLAKGIWSTIWDYKNKKYQPSRLQLSKIKNKLTGLLDNETKSQIELLLSRDYFLEKIIEIKKVDYSGYVYDLHIPEFHNFLSNGIIVHNCLDEFDKMEPSDRVAIHEAMEQSTISIAKAGIVATLNARASILAAANPTFGRYDEYKNVAENIKKLPVTILSRFDLIFIMKDRPDAEKDGEMADRIIENITGGVEPPIDSVLLRKYIHYAKSTCFPAMTPAASDRLKQFYVEKRRLGAQQDSPVPITARQLGALIRLAQAHARMALRKEVTIEDAEAAIRLLEYSLSQVGTDQETGMADIDTLLTGQSTSQRTRLERLHELVREMTRQAGGAASVESIIEEGERQGLQRSFTERAIEQLINEGLLYRPETGKVRPVE